MLLLYLILFLKSLNSFLKDIKTNIENTAKSSVETKTHKIIILNKQPKRLLAAKLVEQKSAKCLTINCDGTGNTRKNFKNHTQRFCPNVKRSAGKAKDTKDKYSLKLPKTPKIVNSPENFNEINELKDRIRSLENEKNLGIVITSRSFAFRSISSGLLFKPVPEVLEFSASTCT